MGFMSSPKERNVVFNPKRLAPCASAFKAKIESNSIRPMSNVLILAIIASPLYRGMS
jgi:hypothetical protein